MKELIGKLSRGVIEYEKPVVEASVTDIDRTVYIGKEYEGAFSVVCENDSKLKGIVYSSNEFVVVDNDTFAGNGSMIRYHINADNLEVGNTVEGVFNIVSNGGEVSIPYKFSVEYPPIESSEGVVDNLFTFTNIVREKYEEAVKIFYDSRFRTNIIGNDLNMNALYDGLCRSCSQDVAIEEFLIATSKKQRVEFTIDDASRDYDSLEHDYGDIIIINKSGWGYIDINVEVDGDFIRDYRKKITNANFNGNSCEYAFTIAVDKLHDGNNFGRITFSNTFQKIVVDISVDNVKDHDVMSIEWKKGIAKLTDMYLMFRMRKYGVNDWAEDSLKIIEKMRGIDDSSAFVKLVQAQIFLSKGMDEQASWLLGNVAEEILDQREKNIELYAYYLYVRTLQKRNPEMTADVLHKVKHYYENGYNSWKLLWILFYLDNAYENNKSLKIARIKEQYSHGCISPLMYYEALNAFNRQPVLLRVLNNFEIHVLLFGCKYEGINLKLALQVADIALLEKRFNPLVFRILESLYYRFENKEILTTICSILIKNNKNEQEFFKWYELGIIAEIKIAGLYEKYIYSMEEAEQIILSETMLMYFLNNDDVLGDRKQMLYAGIVDNHDKIPDIYNKYKDKIELFTIEQLEKGNISKELSCLYNKFIRESVITKENSSQTGAVLNSYQIECFNDNINEVAVIHKELNGEERYLLHGGKAYVRLYTEDTVVLFVDSEGNRHAKEVNYTIKQLCDRQEYVRLCEQMNNVDLHLMASSAEKLLKYHHTSEKAVYLFKRIAGCDDFNTVYKKQIMRDIVEFYYDNYDGSELDGYLRNIDSRFMNSSTRNRVVELMLLRGLDEEAQRFIAKYGITALSSRRLAKFAGRRLNDDGIFNVKDTQILNICIYAFRKGKYNENILKYLCRYYNGSTKEMLDIWKAAKSFDYSDREYEERLLAQMLFTGTQMSSIVKVYNSYYEHGAGRELKRAFLFYESHLYFVKEQPVENDVFKYLESELEYENDLNDMCAAAFLKYYSENEASESTLKVCERIINEFVEHDLYFDFFKKYWGKVKMSWNVMENTVVEYRTDYNKNVFIHYILFTGDAEHKEFVTEEMTQTFKGVFTCKIMMFFGENLMYYITEDGDTGENLTESRNYYIADENIDVNDTRYSKLNEILICKEMREESTIREMMKTYYEEKQLVNQLF